VEVIGISAINLYRAASPLAHLGQRDPRFDTTVMDQGDLKRLIEAGRGDMLLGYQVYVVSRLFAGRRGRREFIDTIREYGGKVVFDTDDDLTDDHRDLGRGGDFKGILHDVDAVTVSTWSLRDQLAPYTDGHRPWVLPNHIDVPWFSKVSLSAKRTVPEGRLAVGFIGTASHYDDWEYPVEALGRLARERDDIVIVAAGYTPDYLKELPNLVQLKAVPYGHYPALMRQFDIVCCALDPNDEFNKCKSAIKALEAMSAARRMQNGKIGGAVAVCTNMPVYRRVVSNRHNGLLVANDEWYDALSGLIDDEQLRTKIAVRGHRWVEKNRNIASGYKLWGRAYHEILRR